MPQGLATRMDRCGPGARLVAIPWTFVSGKQDATPSRTRQTARHLWSRPRDRRVD